MKVRVITVIALVALLAAVNSESVPWMYSYTRSECWTS